VIRESRTQDKIEDMNEATRLLVASLQGQIVFLQNSFDDYKTASKSQIEQLHAVNASMLQQLQQLPNQIGIALTGLLSSIKSKNSPPPGANNNPPPRAPRATPTTTAAAAAASAVTTTIITAAGAATNPTTFPPPPPPPPPAPPPPAAAAQQAAAPQGDYAGDARRQLLALDALAYLGSTARQPVVDKARLPPSWKENLAEWRRFNYESYRHLSMKGWQSREHKGRYIKRKSAIEEIERFAGDHSMSLDKAAYHLDENKTNRKKTLNQHLSQRRKENPGVGSRNQMGRHRQPGAPRRRSAAVVHTAVAAARPEAVEHPLRGAARLAPARQTQQFNNQMGQRIANGMVASRNRQEIQRNVAQLVANRPATADVLQDDVVEQLRLLRRGGA
jgi:hypothetical protein